jgi:hypothetical protein
LTNVPDVVANVVEVAPDLVPLVGAPPKPPPSTGTPAVNVVDVAIVVAELKYGMPPLVPFAVTASVPDEMIGELATVNTAGIVKPTDVTPAAPEEVLNGPRHCQLVPSETR